MHQYALSLWSMAQELLQSGRTIVEWNLYLFTAYYTLRTWTTGAQLITLLHS